MRDEHYWVSLVHELRALPADTGWLEFKRNNGEPQEIGEYLSALEGLPLVLLEIDCAYRHPVQFAGAEFIRIGSYKKRLNDFDEDAGRHLLQGTEQDPGPGQAFAAGADD